MNSAVIDYFTAHARVLDASSLGNDRLVRLRPVSEERQATYVHRAPNGSGPMKFQMREHRIGVVVAAFDGDESESRSFVCFDVGPFAGDGEASSRVYVYENADLETGVDAYVSTERAAALRATAAALRAEVTTYESARGATGTLVRLRVGVCSKNGRVVDEAHQWAVIAAGYPATQSTHVQLLVPYDGDEDETSVLVHDDELAIGGGDDDVDAEALAAARERARVMAEHARDPEARARLGFWLRLRSLLSSSSKKRARTK